MSEYKDRFIKICRDKITREGIESMLDWLNTTDFYTAPASTRFHYSFREGLVRHSLNVYDVLSTQKYVDNIEESEESIAIVALFHDLCKSGFYKESTRNLKNDVTGEWTKVPYYSVEDKFPFGHGEKSVFLIERYIRLRTAEAIAIRWHMGGFDESAKMGGYTTSNAFEKYPLAVKLHLADLEATYLLERDN
ncbi:MAG: hydrolase [Oscillospiraceae bacterium]|nr:hydrolase [Oscillospiraceae bacterium]